MAQRVQIILEDDVDGSDANQTVQFAVDGAAYEIDLSDQHATQLREAFATWVGAARKTGRSTSNRGTSSRASSSKADPAILDTMRKWGRAHGYQVSDRGRIPKQLKDAYDRDH